MVEREGTDLLRMSKMHGKRLRLQAIGLGVIATCCGHGSDLKSYYPLDAGRTWSYALTIRREGDPGKPIEAASTVTNLPGWTLNGRAVTPQESRQFGQIQLRFIAERRRHRRNCGAGYRAADERAAQLRAQATAARGHRVVLDMAVKSVWSRHHDPGQQALCARLISSSVLGGIGSPSGVRKSFSSTGAFFSVGLKVLMPSRASADLIRLMMRVASPTRLLTLAAGPPGILLGNRRDRHHLAVITLASEPSEKGAFQELGVETIRFGTPVLA